MSANRFTMACWTFGSGGRGLPKNPESACWARPHDHITVPAPKTSAPLVGSRYSTKLWVALPDVSTFPNSVLKACDGVTVVEDRFTMQTGIKPMYGDESDAK